MGCLNTNALLAWIDENLIFRPRNMTAPLYRLAYHIWRRTFIGNSPDSDRTETQWKKTVQMRGNRPGMAMDLTCYKYLFKERRRRGRTR